MPKTSRLLALLRLARIGWAANVGHIIPANYTTKLETSTNNTSQSLASNHTSSHGETINLPGDWLPLAPYGGENGTHDGGNGVDGSWDDETKGNSTPVRKPLLVLLARSLQIEVTKDSLNDGGGTKHDGEDTGVEWDTDIWVSDGTSDGGPGSNGWCREWAVRDLRIIDTWVGGGKEYEDTWGEPDGEEGSDHLGIPLLVWWSAEEETGAEIGYQSHGDISTTGSDGTGDQVKFLGLGHVVDTIGTCDTEVVALAGDVGGGTTHDQLRSLCGGSEWGDISDGSDLNAEEGEKEGKDQGEDGESRMHLPLDVADNHGHDSGGDKTGHPHPILDLLLGGSEISDNLLIVDDTVAGVLLGERVGLALGASALSETSVHLVPDGLEGNTNNLVLNEQLNERAADHDHDSWPEEPVSWRWLLSWAVQSREGEESGEVLPWSFRARVATNTLALGDENWTDDTPGHDSTGHHGEGGVETNEHTSADESWSPFNVPSPVLNVESPVGFAVSGPDVDPGHWMPIVKDTNGVVRGNSLDEGDHESPGEALELAGSIKSAGSTSVHGADGDGSGGGSWEDELELARNLDDEEAAEWGDHEDTEEGADNGQGEDTANILLWGSSEKLQLVHGWEGGDEKGGHSTSTDGCGLDDGVLLWSEVTSNDWKLRLGHGLDDTETENGTKHGGGESETSLETCRMR